MKKKKLTNREIAEAIDGLSKNDNILLNMIKDKDVEIKQIFALYLEYSKDTDKFNKFVNGKVKEFEKQRSKDKEGA